MRHFLGIWNRSKAPFLSRQSSEDHHQPLRSRRSTSFFGIHVHDDNEVHPGVHTLRFFMPPSTRQRVIHTHDRILSKGTVGNLTEPKRDEGDEEGRLLTNLDPPEIITRYKNQPAKLTNTITTTTTTTPTTT